MKSWGEGGDYPQDQIKSAFWGSVRIGTALGAVGAAGAEAFLHYEHPFGLGKDFENWEFGLIGGLLAIGFILGMRSGYKKGGAIFDDYYRDLKG
jgi:hypothetical protein